MSKVYVRFPKTGLGNMLLIWARAAVFAKLNHFELITSPWWGFRWGAIIRKEQKNRLYWGYFNESAIWKHWLMYLRIKLFRVCREPVVDLLPTNHSSNEVYVFDTFLTEPDIFRAIRPYQTMVVDALYQVLHPTTRAKLAQYEVPFIGIHVRRGDFKLGSTITPIEFFVQGINLIRRQAGEDLPVTIFSDGTDNELRELLDLKNVSMAENKPDILDILLLGKSKILLLSATSTFSYWGAFLSEAFVIRPANDWLQQIKIQSSQSTYYEVKWQYDEANSTNRLIEDFDKYYLNHSQQIV